ncbi:putative DNA helicase [Helianthus annuus]|uniref:DNA helicase n=1 Tax=Helianthus annuus TaxID=4232 RepID=A0A9K3NJD7_HELAN|nr:putative DNA helicase [Helianthus annuus]KAJ0560844.1 putative DNA helicase [Helianthus annuus]KAJ0567291.1 putative DNA helicase [Helianthus annuus]KAJ0573884.1 putative DNA helicase [Helianthus annuus]KAJ0738220.1 putative DNA helicase [Helianthus annuus]
MSVNCGFLQDLMLKVLRTKLAFCVFYSHKGAVAVRQPYIRVVGIQGTNETTHGLASFTTEDVIFKLYNKNLRGMLFIDKRHVCFVVNHHHHTQ